eukprot:COSAG01_NODE_1580_length_9830_cov_7.852826_5_plen_148_part_00
MKLSTVAPAMAGARSTSDTSRSVKILCECEIRLCVRLSDVSGCAMFRDIRAWHGGTPNLSRHIRAIPSPVSLFPKLNHQGLCCQAVDTRYTPHTSGTVPGSVVSSARWDSTDSVARNLRTAFSCGAALLPRDCRPGRLCAHTDSVGS